MHYTVTGTSVIKPKLGDKAEIKITTVEGPYLDDDEMEEITIRKKTVEELKKE